MSYEINTEHVWCPYPDCGFEGTEDEVNEHRASGVHDDQPRMGSNIKGKPQGPAATL